MSTEIKAVSNMLLATENNQHYEIVNEKTGVVLDDNNGFGYTTAEKAYRAFAYKIRDTSKDVQKEIIKKVILDWLDNHTEFERLMIHEYLMIVPKSSETGIKFNTAYMRKRLKDEGLIVEDFKIGDLFKVWLNKNFEN